MKKLIFYFFALSLLHSKVSSRVLNVKMTDETPGFEVTTDNSRSGIPEITVQFANGIEETVVLDHYGQNDVGTCNYIGYLAESKGNVAVTGCLKKSGDKMDITLLSKYSRNHMFSLDFDGKLNIIASPFSIGATSRAVRGEDDRITDDDEDEVDGDEAAEAAATEIENSAEGSPFPASMPVRVKFGYENSMKNKLAVLGIDFKTFVDSVMAHVQTYYKDASLTTQILFDYDASDLYEDATWTAQDHLDDATTVTKRIQKDEFDLYAWYVADVDADGKSKYGTSGIAWLGVACNNGGPYTNVGKCSINEWWGPDGTTDTAGSAYILAHEMGHNFGMSHDFDKKHGGTDTPATDTNACNKKGIMSYGEGVPNAWSSCSVADFASYYRLKDWGCTCLKDDSLDEQNFKSCCTNCDEHDCDTTKKGSQAWQEWGACNRDCGTGYRRRMCEDNANSQSEKCNTDACNPCDPNPCATDATCTARGEYSWSCSCPADKPISTTGNPTKGACVCADKSSYASECSAVANGASGRYGTCNGGSKAFFDQACMESCGLCAGTPVVPAASVCVDTRTYCPTVGLGGWGGCDGSNKAMFDEYCKKTCGKC